MECSDDPVPSNLNALKMTSRETPMSAAMAAHSDAYPANVRAKNSILQRGRDDETFGDQVKNKKTQAP